MILTQVARLDEILAGYGVLIGKDFRGYRNHVYRVVNFCSVLSRGDAVALEKITIAAAFHDLGIWTDRTFDYLTPSGTLARSYLVLNGHPDWASEIDAMIQEHHKITPYQAESNGLVEAFRQADWVDVTRGLLTFGLPRAFLREVFREFPNAGFHRRLVQLFLSRLVSHPLNPLPMYRL